jgi:hypothetical protein
MPKEVTDPELIKQFDAAQGQGKEVTDPSAIKEFNRGADPIRDYIAQRPQFTQDVSDLGGVAKGAAKSVASTADLILQAGDWLNAGIDKLTGETAPPPGPARQAISEFGAMPPASASAPEKFGYWGGEAAQFVGSGGMSAVKPAVKLGATFGVGELLGSALGFPGVGGLGAVVSRHFLPRLIERFGKQAIKDAIKDAAKEATEAGGETAFKGPGKGGLQSVLERDATRFRSPEMTAWKQKWEEAEKRMRYKRSQDVND